MDFSRIFESLGDKLVGWAEELVLHLPEIVAALAVVVAFALLARFVRRLVARGLDRMTAYRQVNKLLSAIAYLVVLATGTFLALSIVQLDGLVTSLLAGAGIVGLALGFAFQDIASNFIAGIIMAVRQPFREGDIVATNDHFGVVEHINLRATELRTFEGQLVLVPNKDVFQNPIVNYSDGTARRIDLDCGVAYGDDLERARRVALEAIERLGLHDASRPVDLYYTEFGDSSINFTVRFWIDFRMQTDYLEAKSRAIMALKTAFDREGLTIPFPIRTLDFGVVGGEKLSDVLPSRLYDGRDGPWTPKKKGPP